MSEENNSASLQAQFDEIEVLQSIYGNDLKIDKETAGSYAIDITENGLTVSLFVNLPETYPYQTPPVYTISAPSLTKQQKDEICNLLNNEYLENIGASVLYQWIEKIRDFLLKTNLQITNQCDIIAGANEDVIDEVEISGRSQNTSEELPVIIHGDVIFDRKSTFQGHLARVQYVQQVKLILDFLKENKKIANATHNIFAYRISIGNSSFVQDCEDDGETQAGSRLLHLLQIVNASDVLVVVTRWYGGVHLGSDRFRHINNAAREVLLRANLISTTGKQA